VKDFYLGVHELARKHQDVAAVVRLRGHWVDVDPRQWRERRDMTVHVGIGTGNKEAQLIHLSKIEEAQAAAVQVQQGIDGPLVGRKEIFNLQKEKALLAGFPVPELFWIDPNDPDAQQQEQPQEQEGPSPELMLIQGQLELAKEQLNLQRQKHQDEMRMKMFDISTSRDVDMKELEQKYTKMLHEYDLGREQADNARQAGEQRAAADAAKVAAMKSNGSGPP